MIFSMLRICSFRVLAFLILIKQASSIGEFDVDVKHIQSHIVEDANSVITYNKEAEKLKVRDEYMCANLPPNLSK